MAGDSDEHDIEDIEACAQQGRRPRAAGPYRILMGDALMSFQAVIAHEPIADGRGLRNLAALHPPEHHVVFAMFADGILEEIRLEETIDLRTGVEKFIAFKSDRLFRFTINGTEFQWGGAFITGATLLKLARVDAASHVVIARSPDGVERTIGPTKLVDLSDPGVEEFSVRATAGG